MAEKGNPCSEIKLIKNTVTRLVENTLNFNCKIDEIEKESENLKEEVV